MPEVDETTRGRVGWPSRPGDAEASWPEWQRRHRRHKRRQGITAAAALALLAVSGGATILAASGGDGSDRTQTDATGGPADPPSAYAPPASAAVAVEDAPASAPAPAPVPFPGGGPREGQSLTPAGADLYLWGGFAYTRGPGTDTGPTGRAFDATTARWIDLPEAPLTERMDHVAAWTGRELLVWGGQGRDQQDGTWWRRDGAAFDPSTASWRALGSSPLPPDRYEGVWTGTELVVIGGGEATVTGAVYEPASDRWRMIEPPPAALVRSRVVAHDGTVIVVGAERTGEATDVQFRALAYDLATDSWSELGGQDIASYDVGADVVDGVLVVWGHGGVPTWRLDLTTTSWTTGAPQPIGCAGLAGAAEPLAGGIVTAVCGLVVRYDLASDTWTTLDWPSDRWTLVGGSVFLTASAG